MRFLASLLLFVGTAAACAAAEPEGHFRRPVALVAQGERLFVANQRGSISVIDTRTNRLLQETPCGQRLADIASTPWGLMAVDEQAGQLLRLEALADGRVRETGVARIPGQPVSLALSPDRWLGSVASLWGQRLTFVNLEAMKTVAVLDLPFSPRKQWWSADRQRLIVADAYAGQLAVVEVTGQADVDVTPRIVSLRQFEGHNIRGLAYDSQTDELVFAHQLLNGQTHTTRERVFWGSVVSNVLRSVPLSHLLQKPAERATAKQNARPADPPEPLPGDQQEVPAPWDIAHWSFYPLGNPNLAAGDPGELLITPAGQTVVLYAGVDQLAARRRPTQGFERIDLGRRPSGLALHGDGRRVYTANTFDDSVSMLDLETFQTETISLGPTPEPTLADQGESLFYDARLSLDGWYSCHSCHTDGHANGAINDNLGDDTFGSPKRILSLLGGHDTGPWAWTGSQATLSDQIRKSLQLTMRDDKQDQATDANVAALTAYLQTLQPPPSILAARAADPPSVESAASIARGQAIFSRQGCVECHVPPTYTSSAVYDVGLHDERGRTEFNPPSLRGVSQRRSFFHDGRARSLSDVVQRERHQQTSPLKAAEARDLIEFLKSL
ncbi:Cytochrome c551 peroxidase precursor [Lignipirellula cremea]|uniref:Cytochrome c551 peroxidase n=2 Tax=Lignipirellula cremea TaxID=2528010 RepID=A0A518DS10_9BACT|nr:Cytochrome c551 peroxidase precursor [Lignipirellula cremea]